MVKILYRVSKSPKTPQKWPWLGNFKPTARKIKIAILSNNTQQINMKFDRAQDHQCHIVGRLRNCLSKCKTADGCHLKNLKCHNSCSVHDVWFYCGVLGVGGSNG